MRKDLRIREGKPGPGGRMLWRFGSIVARFYYNRKFNIQLENWQILDTLTPPYLIVGNHVMNYDPVIISANQKHLIHWVANDAVFRHPLMRWIFLLFQTIPKTKGMSDLDTVKIMHRKVREGGVVAVFPEGQTTWDGLTQPIMPATAKLAKLLKVPVVGIVNRGGYMTQPRWVWSKDFRKSRMVLDAALLVSEEEIKSLTVDEIAFRLDKGLFNDDLQYQKEHPVPLKSSKRAETLELFAYLCPECGTLDALRSEGDEVGCDHCGWTFRMDEYGCLPSDASFPFKNFAEWGQRQGEITSRIVSEYLVKDTGGVALLIDRGLTLLTGAGLVPMKAQCRGDLKLWRDTLEFVPEEGSSYLFPLKEMDALSIFKQQRLEFYYNKVLYRFHYASPRDSAYKWFKFIEELNRQTSQTL